MTDNSFYDPIQGDRPPEVVFAEFCAATIAEIRTPLIALQGYSELLLMDKIAPLTDQQKTVMKKIVRHANQSTDYASNLWDYASKRSYGQKERDFLSNLTAIENNITVLLNGEVGIIDAQAQKCLVHMRDHIKRAYKNFNLLTSKY
ncbi:MAG: histidine kinase dimerization/phospho-acceptor domain-containing protein [Chloroflexota bacterium]